MPPVRSITIVYDAACGLCTKAVDWIKQQTPLVDVRFVAAESSEARRLFPQLPAGELAVVADTGEVWIGDSAWIICLWALHGYRDVAVKLTSPLLVRLAREAFGAVSRNRYALSSMLRLPSEWEMEQVLRSTVTPQCQIKQA